MKVRADKKIAEVNEHVSSEDLQQMARNFHALASFNPEGCPVMTSFDMNGNPGCLGWVKSFRLENAGELWATIEFNDEADSRGEFSVMFVRNARDPRLGEKVGAIVVCLARKSFGPPTGIGYAKKPDPHSIAFKDHERDGWTCWIGPSLTRYACPGAKSTVGVVSAYSEDLGHVPDAVKAWLAGY